MPHLSELAWPQVRELAAGGAVLAVPLGSSEQHGPHLPLSTDTDIAVALCERLCAARPEVVIAPPVAYGSSGEHAGFAGTISIGQQAIELLVVELVRSAGQTFRRVLLVSAHGGNAEPVGRAVHRLRAESRDVLLFEPRSGSDAHAGESETSVLLVLRPEVVRMEHAVAGDTRSLSTLLPALRAGGVRSVSASGVLGDPTTASAGRGQVLLELLTADLVRAYDEWIG